VYRLADLWHTDAAGPVEESPERGDPMGHQELPAVPQDALERVCARFQVRELAILGSGAGGQLRSDSDIDLLVVFVDGARVGLITFARLRQKLSELFGRAVDLIPKDGLKPALRDHVLEESRTLYAA
jgi:predicted nucleotidyltransferase